MNDFQDIIEFFFGVFKMNFAVILHTITTQTGYGITNFQSESSQTLKWCSSKC